MRQRGTSIAALALVATLAPATAASAQGTEVLRVAFPQEDGGLTPYTFENGYPLMSLVYDTLTLRDEHAVPQPWLARTIRREADGRRVVVTLRRGIRWHDGRPLTAEDVAFTYRHVASRNHPRFTPQVQDIRSVSAVSPRSVVFNLRRRALGLEDQPFADVPILPRHLWAGLPRTRLAPRGLAVGSGPYRLVRHDVERRYVFQANRRYFRGAPKVSRIDVPIVRNEDQSIASLRAGGLDAIPVALAAARLSNERTAVSQDQMSSYNGTMLLFNSARGPFRSREARRAVSSAIDLRRMAGIGAPETTVPANRGMLHPMSRWAAPRDLHRFDRGAARIGLAEAGLGTLPVLVSRGDGVALESGRRAVRAINRSGGSARVVELSPGAYVRALGQTGGRASFRAAIVGIPQLASYDPAFLRAVFGPPDQAPLNDGGYRSARFDRLSDRVAAASTVAERRRLVEQQLRVLAEDVPAVPLVFGGTAYAWRRVAYDDWISIPGTGVLNKHSFLSVQNQEGESRVAARRSERQDPAVPEGGDEGTGTSLVPLIIGLGALLALGSGWWWWRGR